MNNELVRKHLPDHSDSAASGVPLAALDGLHRYAITHAPVGSFLTAILQNNLREAVCRADDANIKAILDIVKYVYNCLPGKCHGSSEKVKAWLEIETQEE